MPLEFPCPYCGNTLSAPDSAAGQAGRCRFCGATVQAPAAPGEPPVPVQAGTTPPPGPAQASGPEAPPAGDPGETPGYGAVPPYTPPGQPGYADHGVPPPPMDHGFASPPIGTIDPGAIVGEAWQVATRNLGVFVGALVILVVILYGVMFALMLLMMPGMMADTTTSDPPAGFWAFQVLSNLIYLALYPMMFGLFSMADEVLTRGTTSIGTLFAPYRRFWRIMGVVILLGLIAMALWLPFFGPMFLLGDDIERYMWPFIAAMIPFAIVVTYVFLGLMWAPLEVVDRNTPALEAIRVSWAMARGRRLLLFGTTLLLQLIYAAGFILCGIGALFTAPIAIVGLMITYRQMRGLEGSV